MINLSVQKLANKSFLLLPASNIIRYSIIITNTGDEDARFVKVRDMLSKGVSIIPSSIVVDGCPQSNCRCSDSIFVGTVRAGGNVIVTFDVKVCENTLLESVSNRAVVTYIDSTNQIFSVESNESVVAIINLKICAKKSVDKLRARVGETLTYSVLIRNDSTVPLTNVLFFDELEANLSLVAGSIRINSIPQAGNSLNGLPLGTINPHSSILVSFEATINDIVRLSTIRNTASITYEYTVIDNGVPVVSTAETTSNCVRTQVLFCNC